jgi:hypothetical protein
MGNSMTYEKEKEMFDSIKSNNLNKVQEIINAGYNVNHKNNFGYFFFTIDNETENPIGFNKKDTFKSLYHKSFLEKIGLEGGEYSDILESYTADQSTFNSLFVLWNKRNDRFIN